MLWVLKRIINESFDFEHPQQMYKLVEIKKKKN